MRKFYFIFSLFFLGGIGIQAHAQCSGGAVYVTLNPTANWQTEAAVWAGDLLPFTAVAGVTYEFSMCPTDGGSASFDTELTIQNAQGTPVAYNDDFCGLQSKITWTAPSSGTFQLLLTEFQCLTNQLNSTVAYRSISPSNPNDVSITSALFGSEYTRVPLQHVQAQTFDGDVTNVGSQTANGMGMRVEVIDAQTNSVLQTFNSPLSNNVASGASQNFQLGPWTPSQQGIYRIRYTALASINTVSTNDTVSYLFHVTDSTFARDDNVATGSLTIGSVGNPNPGEIGAVYQMQTAVDLTTVDVWVNNSQNNATGTTFNLIIRQASQTGIPGAQIGTTASFTVPAGFNNWVNLPVLNGPINLQPGRYAICMVEGNTPVPVNTTNFIFNTNTFWVNAPALTVGWEPFENFNITDAYGLRMNVQPPCPNLSSSFQTTPPGCNQSNGSASVTITGDPGPYNYSWSNGGTGASIQNVPAGTYIVTATLPTSGCSITDTVVLSNPAAPVIQNITTSPLVCFGQTGSATPTVTGGSPGYNYAWSNGSQNPTLNAGPGTYTLTVTDASNCSVTSGPVQIVGPSNPLTLSISQNDPTCGQSNGDATVTANGGYNVYTYSWSTGATTAGIQNLNAGTYIITVTDSGGCSAIDTASLVSPGSPNIVPGTISAPLCNGDNNGSIQINVSGGQPGYNYLWSDGSTGSSLTAGAGSYTVTVTDNVGCSTTSPPIAIPSQPAITSQISSTASGCTGASGTATVNAAGGAGGFNYTWSNGGSGASLQNISPGQYIVTITDANNCSLNDTVVVQAATPPVINNIQATDADCFGQNGYILVDASGSNGTLTYTWSNGANGDSLSAGQGQYQVIVSDPLGCSDTAQATINEPSAITNNFNITDANCNASDGEAIASASGGNGGFTYSWSNGNQGPSSGLVAAANYIVTITDANNCTLVDTAVVANIGAPTVNGQVIEPLCAGDSGQVVLTVNGGTPGFTYAWDNGSTAQSPNLPAGTFNVVVTDMAGCVVNAGPYTLTDPPAINLSVVTSDATGPGNADGSATVTATGGTGNIMLNWSNGSSGATDNALLPGAYVVYANDANGCKDSISFTIGTVMGIGSSSWVEQVVLAPNPSTDFVFLSLPAEISVESVSVLDASGRSFHIAFEAETGRLDVRDLAKGVYTLQIRTKNGELAYFRLIRS